MEKVLSGKAALVTGGAGGFGKASAMLLARDGAAVTLMGRTEESLQAARAEILADHPQAKVQTYTGDATSPKDVGAAMDLAASGEDRFEIVVGTVGGGMARPIAECSLDYFMAGVTLNLAPGYVAIREGIDRIESGGTFVFISTTAAVIPFDGMPAYCAGKAALEHLIRAAAHELGDRGHRFNAVRPGLTRTGATPALFTNKPLMDRFLERIPLGRPGEPEEIAEAVRYFAGPESSWTTGQSFAIDGGNELRGAPVMGKR